MKGMRWRAAILQCKKCGWYSGWKARRNRGVKTIDTLCSVCNSRLRHTPSPDEGQAGGHTDLGVELTTEAVLFQGHGGQDLQQSRRRLET
jgi:hypothetical protein